MGQGFGMETPSKHRQPGAPRKVARYLVLIESGGSAVARLFSESREPLGEFDASSEETASMTGAVPALQGAEGPEWDRALAGHSQAERAAADIYRLPV
jgi:hypothetical protein